MGIILYVILASPRALTVVVEDWSRPIAAESDVKDQPHIPEIVINNAALILLIGYRGCAPCAWVGVGSHDVIRNLASGPEPDVDVFEGPINGVDAAANVVEAVTKEERVLSVDVAAFVNGTELAGWEAVVGGVDWYGVAGIMVDAFDDVDLAVCGPA